jgi:mannosyl-oligosaccharide alpha-1,2-mannosidase
MLSRRFVPIYFFICIFTFAWFFLAPSPPPKVELQYALPPATKAPPKEDGKYQWAQRKENYPVSSMIPLPTGTSPTIPKIQHAFKKPTAVRAAEMKTRRDSVQGTFDRAWEGYKNKAWMKDELAPISGASRNAFGGWAATLVDTLDTLWIMNKTVDFEQAVADVKNIDFTTTGDAEINTFETTIRYMGGLLATHDLSEGKYPQLLEKAVELGNFLYAAFDTPNRMPITRWKWQKYVYSPRKGADS